MKQGIVLIFLTALLLSGAAKAQTLPEFKSSPSETPVEHEASDPDLSGPRAVMKTFLTAMNEVKHGKKEFLDKAVKTLDLRNLPAIARKVEGPELAWQLLGIIDRTRLVKFEIIPRKIKEGKYLFARYPAGKIEIEKGETNWRFSNATVAAIPDIYRNLEDKPLVKGIENDGENKTLALKIRSSIPRRYKRKSFLIEDWQWAALIVLLFVLYLARIPLQFLLMILTNRLFMRLKFLAGAESLKDMFYPLSCFILLSVFRALLNLLSLPPEFYAGAVQVVSLLQVFAVAVAAYRATDLIGDILAVLSSKTANTVDDVLVNLFKSVGKVAVWVIAVLYIATIFEINITGVIAGLGLGGLAFALAAKDTIENLFGSFTVLLDQPFTVGDYIDFDGIKGTVENVGFRSTRIRTPYNSLVTLPNSKLISTSVDNLGARKYRRTKTILSVTYDTPVEKIEAFCEGIRELIKANPAIRQDYYHVHFNEFAASSLDILVNVYLVVGDYTEELRERERFFLDIMKLAEALQIEFAFPTRTLHVFKARSPSSGKTPDTETAKNEAVQAARRIVKAGI